MRFIFSYVNKYFGRMSIGLLIKVIGTLIDLLLPYILAYILDKIIPLGKTGLVIWYGVIMVVCSIAALILNVIANRMASLVAKKTTYNIRKDLFTKITCLSQSQTDKITIPSLVSRMTSDTYNVNNIVGMMQRIGVRAPILLIGGIVITMTINMNMALVMIISLPIIVLAIVIITSIGVPLYSKVQKSLDHLVMVVRENISGAKVIKALGKSEYEQERFKKINDTCVTNDIAANKVMASLNPILNLIMNIGLVLVIYVGAKEVFQGQSTSGEILAFTTYFTIILNAILSVSRIFIGLSKANASAKRIKEIMDINDDILVDKLEDISKNYLEFRNVTFSYNHKKSNLNDISFSLHKGESLGIIGSTGSGKSTIINLLMRYYDVDKGSIYRLSKY